MVQRRGFIILFGTRESVGNESVPPLQATCPSCGRQAMLLGKTHRTWFTLFFIPIFPISALTRFSQCSACGSHFRQNLDEMRHLLAAEQQNQNQRAIALYNSLRNSPANSVTLNELMHLYSGMQDWSAAISAAATYPEALNASEQCMTTLGRVYLAQHAHAEALRWLDAAIAKNPAYADAHYYKAAALLTMQPPQPQHAASAARAAMNAGFTEAQELLREAEQMMGAQPVRA